MKPDQKISTAISEVQKRYCSRALIVAIIISFIMLIAGYKPMGKGFVLGAVFSILNFILMGRFLPAAISKNNRKNIAVSFGGIFVRYFILAIPLMVSLKFEKFDPITTALGLFMIQSVIVYESFSNRLKSFAK